MKQPAEEIVLSPCVGICSLDEEDICIGCLRSGNEISRWGYLDNAGKREILARVEQRFKDSQS